MLSIPSIAARIAVAALAAALLLAPGTGQTAPSEAPDDGVYADHVDWCVVMVMTGPASAAQTLWGAGFRDYLRTL